MCVHVRSTFHGKSFVCLLAERLHQEEIQELGESAMGEAAMGDDGANNGSDGNDHDNG